MRYRVEDIKTVGGTDLLYVEVAFIEDGRDRSVHYNDFALQIFPTQNIYIGPDIGPGDIDPDEVYVPNPGDYEAVETNVRQVIIDKIEAYMGRLDKIGLENKPFDDRSNTLRRTKVDTDPLGLRGKPGVEDLVGIIRQRPARP